jgi:hypothetical protein
MEYEDMQRVSASRSNYGSQVVHVTRIPTAKVPPKTSKAAIIERIAFTIIKERVRFEYSISLKLGNRNGGGEVIYVIIETNGLLSDEYKADQFLTLVLVEILHQAITYAHEFVHVWVEFHGPTVSLPSAERLWVNP